MLTSISISKNNLNTINEFRSKILIFMDSILYKKVEQFCNEFSKKSFKSRGRRGYR